MQCISGLLDHLEGAVPAPNVTCIDAIAAGKFVKASKSVTCIEVETQFRGAGPNATHRPASAATPDEQLGSQEDFALHQHLMSAGYLRTVVMQMTQQFGWTKLNLAASCASIWIVIEAMRRLALWCIFDCHILCCNLTYLPITYYSCQAGIAPSTRTHGTGTK